MTTLRDLLRDMLTDYDKRITEVRRTTLDDDMPDAEIEALEGTLDEYIESIKERWVG